jgi:hypothetical protein
MLRDDRGNDGSRRRKKATSTAAASSAGSQQRYCAHHGAAAPVKTRLTEQHPHLLVEFIDKKTPSGPETQGGFKLFIFVIKLYAAHHLK